MLEFVLDAERWQGWIEQNGYYVLGGLILCYFLYTKGIEAYTGYEKEACLKQAQEPDRKRALQQIREKQQLALEKSAEEYAKNQSKKKEEQKRQNLGKLATSSSSSSTSKSGTFA